MAEKKITPWTEIVLSKKGNEALAKLPKGFTMAVRMRHVNNSKDDSPKIQIEFAEKINNNVIVAAGILNANDDRFSSGAQRAWESADAEIAINMFGKIPDGEASVEILKVLKPDSTGQQFRLQLTECLESELTENELQYAENYLKRAGKEGDYFYSDSGERVASRKRLVVVSKDENPPNTFIKGSFKPDSSLADVMTGSKAALSEDMKDI